MAIDLLLCNSYYLVYETMGGARGQPYPSLGILYLAAYLKQKGPWDIAIFDATFSKGLEEFSTILERDRPAVVGIQSVITTRVAARRMIEIAHKAGVKIVVGGPDPSSSYTEYLNWGADFIVVGEGEETLLQLMPHLLSSTSCSEEIKNIHGLAFYKHNSAEVCYTGPGAPIMVLDEIPFPAYDMIDVPRYLDAWRVFNGYSSMHLTTSRGCPYQCVWCSHSVFGSTYRQRSVANVVGEMKFLAETYHPDHFTIADDTLGINKQWVQDWRRIIQEEQVRVPFRCFSRANLVNEMMLAELKLAGCRHIFLGVETGSQKVLNAMNKGITIEQVRKATKLIRSFQIDLGFFIMFAFPGETVSDVHKTLDLIFELEPESLGMSIAYPVPGTLFYDMVKDRIIPGKDKTEESMGSGRELGFKASYPIQYYLAVIRYIELMRQRKNSPKKQIENILLAVQIWLYSIRLSITEAFMDKSGRI